MTKWFPGVCALRDVSLDVLSGEVHGLVGENGAGKSTLIKLITGAFKADDGVIELFGDRLDRADPREAQRAGVAVIYQERSIVPELSAAANVFLGHILTNGLFISRRAGRKRFQELADSLGADINPDGRAGSLSVANQQLLEIMRALDAERRVLILDEPTTALGAPERQRLFAIIDDLRRRGLAMVFISHALDEVLALCDRVSVMRDGELVATEPVSNWTKETLVTAMLGGASLSPQSRPPIKAGAEVIRVENFSVPGSIEDVSFSLREGEVLGIAGLIGSGRTEILRALAGADRGARGRFFVAGKERKLPRSVAQALKYGIALAPEDRKAQGLVLDLDGVTNVSMTDLGVVSRFGVIDSRRRYQRVAEVTGNLNFSAERLRTAVRTLSGGNQQKLVFGKWLHSRPKVLLLDEPTQGIDIGAKAEVFRVIHNLAQTGMAVIFVSSEFEEVVNVADRVLVVGDGRLLSVLDRDEISVKKILDLLFDVNESA